MRPYITIGSIEIYMTWLGIVTAFLTFIATVFVLARKYKVSFLHFFTYLPVLITSLYCMWLYSFLVIEYSTLLPPLEFIIQAASPYGYNFHPTGLMIALAFFIVVFLHHNTNTLHKRKRIDILFTATSISLIPLGIFLVLGDDFIGISTQSDMLGIQSLTEQSRLSKYAKVLPAGLFLSLAWLLALIITQIIQKRYKKIGSGYLGFSILAFLISIVFFFQQYPKHGVANFFGITVDIKHYTARTIAIICLLAYIHMAKKIQLYRKKQTVKATIKKA